MRKTELVATTVSVLVFALSSAAYAQAPLLPEKDSLSLPTQNQTSLLRKKLSNTQQLLTLQKPTINFKLRADTLIKPDSTLRIKNKIDSLRSVGNSIVSKPTQIQNKIQEKVNQPINYINQRVQTTQNRITKPADSLNRKLTKEISSIEDRINQPIDKIQNKANAAVQKAASDTGVKVDNIDLPATEKLGSKVDVKVSDKLPGNVKLDQVNTKDLIKTDLPKIDGLTQNDQVKELMDKKSELQNFPKEKLQELKAADKLKDVSGKVDKLDDKLAKVETLEDDAKKIAEGKVDQVKQLPQEVENRFAKLDEGKELSAKAKQIQEYEDRLKKYQDKKLIQQELKAKALTIANEEKMKNAALVKKAQDGYAKAKRVHGSFQSTKDLKRLPPNAMKGKPLRARIVPGLTFQVYQSDKLRIDLGPQLGFRVSGRITTGIGGVYRISINKSNKYFVANENIFGGRFYTDVLITKGFYGHADFEYLRTNSLDINSSEQWQNRVAASHFGLGKSYSISKRLKGSAMGLYRLEYAGHLPSPKFILRMGLEWQLGKKKKKPIH